MNPKARTNRRAVGHVKPLSVVRRQTRSYPTIAPYVIALSQTDTVEQARWMHALDTRMDGADGRSSNTKPNDSAASYVVALSQTDTVEQARWMHALDARTEDVHRRPRSRFWRLSNGRLVEGIDTHGTLVKHLGNGAPGEDMKAPPRGFQPDAVAGPRVVAFRRDARATARRPMPPSPAIVIRLADRRRTRHDATPTILFSSTAAFLEQ